MPRKLSVSIEAMERAIKARLLSRHGLFFAAAYRPIPVRHAQSVPSKSNWTIDLGQLPADSHAALREAEQHLGRSLQLDGAPRS